MHVIVERVRALASRRTRILLLLCVSAFAAASFVIGPADAAIPRKGSIAVLVKGTSQQHAAMTTSIITRGLIAKGYKVVDPKKQESIRRNKAAALALQGNVEAIMRLSKTYGLGMMITVDVEAGEPIENEFKLFTGTASVAVMATSSSGSRVYADAFGSKEVGYSQAEAAQKSVESAARLAVAGLTE